MKNFFSQKTFNVIVLIVLFVMGVLLYLAFCQIDDQMKLHEADSRALYKSLSQQAVINSNNATYRPPVISVSENAVYFPDMQLKIPLDDQGLPVMYFAREVGNSKEITGKTYDVVTRDFLAIAPSLTSRLACTPVRLAFEAKPNPYNPHEHPAKPVALADGRTLQIYTADEDSCKQAWKFSNTDPLKLGAVFQKASSY